MEGESEGRVMHTILFEHRKPCQPKVPRPVDGGQKKVSSLSCSGKVSWYSAPQIASMCSLTLNRKVDTFHGNLGWIRVYDLTNDRPFDLVTPHPGHGG